MKKIIIIALFFASCKKEDLCSTVTGTYIAVAQVNDGKYNVITDTITFIFNNGKMSKYKSDSLQWITPIDCKRIIVSGNKVFYTFNLGYPFYYDILKKK